MYFADVFAGLQAVAVEVAPALVVGPGTGPDGLRVGVHRDARTVLLPALRVDRIGPLELQRLRVIHGDLQIRRRRAAPRLRAGVDLSLIDINVAQTVRLARKIRERGRVRREQFPVLAIAGQNIAPTDPVLPIFAGDSLPAADILRRLPHIGKSGQDHTRIGLLPPCHGVRGGLRFAACVGGLTAAGSRLLRAARTGRLAAACAGLLSTACAGLLAAPCSRLRLACTGRLAACPCLVLRPAACMGSARGVLFRPGHRRHRVRKPLFLRPRNKRRIF